MSNVLPIEEKQRLTQRVTARFMCVGSLVLLLGALIASLSLVPTFASLSVAQAALTRANEGEVAETAREDQAKAARAQLLADTLRPIVQSTSTPPSVPVAAALALKPAGVRITSISYGKGSIVLSGESANRQAVNAFRDALEKEKRFTSVVVPVAALVGTQEGRFTMTLSGAF